MKVADIRPKLANVFIGLKADHWIATQKQPNKPT